MYDPGAASTLFHNGTGALVSEPCGVAEDAHLIRICSVTLCGTADRQVMLTPHDLSDCSTHPDE